MGALEAYYCLKTNKTISLSEQNIVDCLESSHDNCQGGWSTRVFDYLYLSNFKINSEKDYPYKGTSGTCRFDKSRKVKDLSFSNYEITEGNEEAIKKAVTEHGPISLAVAVNKYWSLYKGGVWYEKECSEFVNHCILLIGYGRENGQDYWLLKNSWGKEWGENGYMKFSRNKHNNYCGITQFGGSYLI